MPLPANPEADLRNAIRERRAVILAGTGVSMAASRDPRTRKSHPQASWVGLLKSGLKWLQSHKLIPADTVRAHLTLLKEENAKTHHFISAAQDVTRFLGGAESMHFAAWLTNTIGRIKACDREGLDALEALRRHGTLLATSNYDSLLLDDGGALKPVTWKEPDEFLRAARNRETDKVIFLHGYWRKPPSVILDWGSYQEIAFDEHYRQCLAAVWQMTTWVYVGCGVNGLSDPDFGLLLKRYGKCARNAGLWDYCLVRQSQREEFQARFDTLGLNICAVSFGKSHADLPQYLRSLLVPDHPPGLAITIVLPSAKLWSEVPVELHVFYAHPQHGSPSAQVQLAKSGEFALAGGHAPTNSPSDEVHCLLTDIGQRGVVAFNIYRSDKSKTFETKPWYSDDANLVPLHPDLVVALGGKTTGMATPGRHIKSPEKLVAFANVLETAARHAKEWRFGCAIGCYRLASCLCPASHDKDQRLQITCEPIRHLRHHVHSGILANTLHDVFGLLDAMGSVQGETLLSLEYDLLALLDEHGLQLQAMEIAKELHSKKIIDQYGKTLKPDKISSIKRRVYSICLMDPDRTAMGKLHEELEGRAEDIEPLRASLATTQVVEALLTFMKSDQKNAVKALEAAWEKVCGLCEEFESAFRMGKKPNAGPSDVAELFYYRAVLAHFLKPQDGENIVNCSCKWAEERFGECHARLTNPYVGFWNTMLLQAGIGPYSDTHIARLTRNLTRKELPDDIQENVWRILDKARSMLIKS